MAESKTYAVIGLGTFGAQAARELYHRGSEVLVIDILQSAVDAIKNDVSHAICGDAMDEEVLKTAGFFEADAVIVAMRKNFDKSVLATHLLHQHGQENIWVQVDSLQEASALKALGAKETILPEIDVAKSVAHQILFPRLADMLPLGNDFALVEFPLSKACVGFTLMDLDIRRRYRVNVVGLKRAVTRRYKTELVLIDPAPDEPFKEDDIVLVLGNMERLSRFQSAMESGQVMEGIKKQGA